MNADKLSLAGRRVLVTGASSGIGRATAQLCSELGASLVCVGRDAARLNETLETLAGKRHSLVLADVDDADELLKVMQSSVATTEPLAGIVHCAGTQRPTPLRIAKSADFEAQYRTNALSAALITSAVARRGVARPEGCSVVLVGSVMSVLGAAGLSAYCMSKAALTGLVRSAALELAPARIRVNAVLPGVVDTPMSQRFTAPLAPEQVKAIEQMHPLGLGEPADVAYPIAFLLSDAARWITGSCLTVDGGYSAH